MNDFGFAWGLGASMFAKSLNVVTLGQVEFIKEASDKIEQFTEEQYNNSLTKKAADVIVSVTQYSKYSDQSRKMKDEWTKKVRESQDRITKYEAHYNFMRQLKEIKQLISNDENLRDYERNKLLGVNSQMMSLLPAPCNDWVEKISADLRFHGPVPRLMLKIICITCIIHV